MCARSGLSLRPELGQTSVCVEATNGLNGHKWCARGLTRILVSTGQVDGRHSKYGGYWYSNGVVV